MIWDFETEEPGQKMLFFPEGHMAAVLEFPRGDDLWGEVEYRNLSLIASKARHPSNGPFTA